jgi:hypothetical protein
MKGLGWAIGGIAILLVIVFWNDAKTTRIDRPAYAIGRIMSFGTNGRSGATYLRYTFEVAGKTFSGWAPKENCRDCVVGSQVKIVYAEEKPETSDLIK